MTRFTGVLSLLVLSSCLQHCIGRVGGGDDEVAKLVQEFEASNAKLLADFEGRLRDILGHSGPTERALAPVTLNVTSPLKGQHLKVCTTVGEWRHVCMYCMYVCMYLPFSLFFCGVCFPAPEEGTRPFFLGRDTG